MLADSEIVVVVVVIATAVISSVRSGSVFEGTAVGKREYKLHGGHCEVIGGMYWDVTGHYPSIQIMSTEYLPRNHVCYSLKRNL